MTPATPLDMDIELCFVHCALESGVWQRLSAIKVELELEFRIRILEQVVLFCNLSSETPLSPFSILTSCLVNILPYCVLYCKTYEMYGQTIQSVHPWIKRNKAKTLMAACTLLLEVTGANILLSDLSIAILLLYDNRYLR